MGSIVHLYGFSIIKKRVNWIPLIVLLIDLTWVNFFEKYITQKKKLEKMKCIYLPIQLGNVLSHVCLSRMQTNSRLVAAVSGKTYFESQTKFKTCSVLWTKLTCDGIGGSIQPNAVLFPFHSVLHIVDMCTENASTV